MQLPPIAFALLCPCGLAWNAVPQHLWLKSSGTHIPLVICSDCWSIRYKHDWTIFDVSYLALTVLVIAEAWQCAKQIKSLSLGSSSWLELRLGWFGIQLELSYQGLAAATAEAWHCKEQIKRWKQWPRLGIQLCYLAFVEKASSGITLPCGPDLAWRKHLGLALHTFVFMCWVFEE